ncbi:Cyclic nucleotide-binding domain-containing protein 2 [Acropora cervicornis]|uniref:Cyclic nucleotide-binding domain-containing protein 2 n=1 Tax=Acropora cervicornis TaxID=6130 RepID=A0AAD9Q7W1_ACRCE|nr:Cyclic nucleotide-binding domain-containing protein 2 [Acropora cervicornis]
MDAQSYDFLHRVTNWIFKSKAGMAFEKSIININVNFDNEDGSIRRPPRKNRKDNLMATVQPSVEAQRTSFEIQKRVQEIQTFRQESQSAIEAPLLVTALVRKTHQRLDTIEEKRHWQLSPLEKFAWAARVVQVLVSCCMRWRRYKKPEVESRRSSNSSPQPGRRKSSQKSQKSGVGIGFDSRTFKEKSKISDDLRHTLTLPPLVRKSEELKKVQRLCRSTRAFMIFPLEREVDLSRCVAYERYDNGRVLACQGRVPNRFYYILSGRVSKVCVYDLAAGITKMSFGELIQGNTTDPVELMNGNPREHSLICKGSVEVLVLDREDFMEVMNSSPEGGLPIEMLRSIELFRNFPLEKFFEEKDAIVTKYFAKDTVIVRDSNDTPYFFIVKSGRCKVARKQDVLDMSKTTKLPTITTDTNIRAEAGITLTDDCGNLLPDENHNLERNKELNREPVFAGPTDEVCVRRQSKIRRKVSETSMAVPTRTALVQIALLKPGNMFGLESMMAKVASKINSQPDAVEEEQDPSARGLILREEYMTVLDARHRIQCLESWDLYKGQLVKTLATRTCKRSSR